MIINNNNKNNNLYGSPTQPFSYKGLLINVCFWEVLLKGLLLSVDLCFMVLIEALSAADPKMWTSVKIHVHIDMHKYLT